MAALLAVTGGCQREEIRVYRVAKEAPPVAADAARQAPHPTGAPVEQPRLQWQLPEGWEEQAPSAMRVASFTVRGAAGRTADVAVIPLPGVGERELELVNMWRSQVRLGPVAAADLARLANAVPLGSGQARLFDMAGESPAAGESVPLRVLVAMLERDGTTWFFKMTGPADLVGGQKSAFLEFLRSVQFVSGSGGAAGQESPSPDAAPVPQAAVAVAGTGRPQWDVPAGWQETAAGPFLVAKFTIVGEDGSQAAVNISHATGQGGGWVENVNRWRGQLGLGELSAEEVTAATTTRDTAGGTAMMVEWTGTDARTGRPARLIGARVLRPDGAWFYKLMGDAPVVESQREAFQRFLRSARY